ncbi:Secreted protein [Plasmodiophora brassicae]
MQVLLGISLCVLLLTFRTGGVLVAGVDFEDDCWADVVPPQTNWGQPFPAWAPRPVQTTNTLAGTILCMTM